MWLRMRTFLTAPGGPQQLGNWSCAPIRLLLTIEAAHEKPPNRLVSGRTCKADSSVIGQILHHERKVLGVMGGERKVVLFAQIRREVTRGSDNGLLDTRTDHGHAVLLAQTGDHRPPLRELVPASAQQPHSPGPRR